MTFYIDLNKYKSEGAKSVDVAPIQTVFFS